MKKVLILLFPVLLLTGCEDFLDRPPLTQMNDITYWTTENNVRVFANGFYSNYFVGYNNSWGVAYAPLRGYLFADDFASTGKQLSFETQAPESRQGTSESIDMLPTYAGPTWNFAWVRKANIFLDRIEKMKGTYLDEEAYNHWSAVARFFRGYEYSRLVSVFGDVPYFGHDVGDDELDELYKDRDDRTTVMNQVYEDFKYVLENMRLSDGDAQYLNRYIAAGFISRFMLFEGTWQKYHLGDNTHASKFLELAVEAGDLVVESGKWSFGSAFRTLFGSESLAGHPEVLMYRAYDAGLGVTHHIASYSNRNETQPTAANLDLARSFICADGQPYKLSGLPNADKEDIQTMAATRDSRFEATFWDEPQIPAATLLYATKFIDREGVTYQGTTPPPRYGSNTNTNDAPIMRLAEVVLNWIEAKAELATLGGPAVTQADLDASVNAIRSRPLDDVASDKGLVQTAPLDLGAIPDDPDRDGDVLPLLWEIRRERRMEFVFEHTRLLDIKRWKKLEYMDGDLNPDILRGPWVDFPAEKAAGRIDWLVEAKEGILKVEKENGTIVTYDGDNAADMVGYYIPENISNRDPVLDRMYLAPIGNSQISAYIDKGYTLTQTTGW